MAIEDVSLYEDLLKLANGPEYGTRKKLECTLITTDFHLKALAVTSFAFNRDYMESYGDSIIMEVMVPMGTFMDKIYPYRQSLKTQVRSTLVNFKGEEIDDNKGTAYKEFRATIVDSRSPSIMNATEESDSLDLGDTGSILNISLQLTDPILETIRQTTSQLIIKDSTVDDVITAILKGDLFIRNELPKPEGVIMTPSDNSKKYKQLIFPPTLNLISIPGWMQREYGVYNSGIGVYLQRDYWYVFPLLQTEHFKEENTSVTIVAIPPYKMSGSEKTFDFKNSHLVILATGGIEQIDNTDSEQRNYGNGLKYINSERVMDCYSKTENGITTIDKSMNIIEFKSLDRADGGCYVPFSKSISSNNHANALTEISKTQSNIITINWENSIPDLLLPGMSCRYLYRENAKVKTLTGILVNVEHRYVAVNPGILQDVHSGVSKLTMLAQSIGIED